MNEFYYFIKGPLLRGFVGQGAAGARGAPTELGPSPADSDSSACAARRPRSREYLDRNKQKSIIVRWTFPLLLWILYAAFGAKLPL